MQLSRFFFFSLRTLFFFSALLSPSKMFVSQRTLWHVNYFLKWILETYFLKHLQLDCWVGIASLWFLIVSNFHIRISNNLHEWCSPNVQDVGAAQGAIFLTIPFWVTASLRVSYSTFKTFSVGDTVFSWGPLKLGKVFRNSLVTEQWAAAFTQIGTDSEFSLSWESNPSLRLPQILFLEVPKPKFRPQNGCKYVRLLCSWETFPSFP